MTDSPAVLAALGKAQRVDALARGRHGRDAVVIAVADGRVLVVAVGFFSDMGHAARQTSPVRLDLPVAAVRFSAVPTVVLESPTERFDISDVRERALAGLSRAFAMAEDPIVGEWRAAAKPAGDWRAAEELAVRHLRDLGFHDARTTAGGADGGVDVVATGAVAQVKHWAQPVGQPPLRDLFGVAQAAAATAFFYSRSGYTPAALEWANATGIALFTYTLDGQVQACNAAGHERRKPGAALGFFAQMRADRYRKEQAGLRGEIDRLTSRMAKRTQSRRASARQSAGTAAGLLLAASRTLDGGDVLPPADRRREDTYKVVRDALTQVKQLL
ncbi:restriction endonuclease [Actinoplanes hulinensis]|uniref:Restriction endonuclease n=1 Tax=Actinoplanes hulinensis TaxID=1144547 RepID=A0ABS7B2F2_9ACTN|nr:restriction endonuclease [Actinoplanes hulinensis]MBW6434989.1 restriction endonuclease [Actinoplanes hulinensis]